MEWVIGYALGGVFCALVSVGLQARAGQFRNRSIENAIATVFALALVFVIWPVFALLWSAGFVARKIAGG